MSLSIFIFIYLSSYRSTTFLSISQHYLSVSVYVSIYLSLLLKVREVSIGVFCFFLVNYFSSSTILCLRECQRKIVVFLTLLVILPLCLSLATCVCEFPSLICILFLPPPCVLSLYTLLAPKTFPPSPPCPPSSMVRKVTLVL